MSIGARLILWGMLLVLIAIAGYIAVDWEDVLTRFPHYARPLRSVVRPMLELAWYWAFIVPALLFAVGVYRFAVAKGGRLAVAWRLFAFFTLWAIGSFAFFFGLFLVYAPEMGGGARGLLLPAVVACFGYLLIGLGFLASMLRAG